MCICTHMGIYTQIPRVLWIMLHCPAFNSQRRQEDGKTWGV